MSHTVDAKKQVESEQPDQPRPAQQETSKPAPLSTDPATLVDEWRRYQGFIAQVNIKIRENQQTIEIAQQTIESLKTQGLQVVGQANTILRILTGMGVDPNKYGFSDEPKTEDISLQGMPSPAHQMPKLVDKKEDKGNPKLAALKKRFSR